MADYYVDQTLGNDGNVGSLLSPWKTLAKVNLYNSFVADDHIYLKSGETWREQLQPKYAVGSSGHPITFGRYGGGALPRILGSVQVSSWSDLGGNKWSATCASAPHSVFFVDAGGVIVWGIEQGSLGALTAEYDWYFTGTTLSVYAASSPDTRYVSVEATQLDGNVDCYSWGNDYTIFSDLELAYSNHSGIHMAHRTGVEVSGCWIHHIGIWDDSFAEGITMYGSSQVARNCRIHDCGNHGVGICAHNGETVVSALVEWCILYDNYHSSIDCQCFTGGTFTSAILRYNIIYGTDATIGLNLAAINLPAENADPASINGLEIYFNLIYDMYNYGINVTGNLHGTKLYNNVLHNCYISCIAVLTQSGYSPTGIILKNNIGVECPSENGRCLSIDDTAFLAACDYNCWFQSIGGKIFTRALDLTPTDYHSDDFAAWKANSGFDIHSVWTDPLFVNAGGGDFHLQETSPCINAGTDVGISLDCDGYAVPQGAAPDMGIYESSYRKTIQVVR